jgi:NAD(P)-dependent dehydrogenase (short-subunit alcohol dehydrogenase family)
MPQGEAARREALSALAPGASPRPAETGPLRGPDPVPELTLDGLFGLQDKVAVLTDVGGGGSAKIAQLLATAGARVVVADRALAAAKAHADEILEAGGKAAALEVDVEDEKAVVALFAEVAAATGRLDILVNCFGMLANQPLTEMSSTVWDETISLNLRANFLCMREAVKHMIACGRGGRIVNVTTMGVSHPVLNNNHAYGAARLGVTALTKSTALDHARYGILANTVLAGSVMDKVIYHDTLLRSMEAGYRTGGPISGPGRLPLGNGDMADVAAAVLYLVSPAGRYITGQSISLDGGFLIA